MNPLLQILYIFLRGVVASVDFFYEDVFVIEVILVDGLSCWHNLHGHLGDRPVLD
jgi:hypothetical protein